MTEPSLETCTERIQDSEPPGARTAPAASPPPGAAKRRSLLRPSILTLAAVSLGLHLIDRLFPAGWTGSPAHLVAILLIGAGFCVISWTVRKTIYRTLTSVPFAVTLLLALAAATVLGTLIVQAAHPQEYAERYGSLAPLIQWWGLNDIFRTAWFNGMLVLVAVSLALVVVKKRSWRLSQWGHLLSHGGVTLVLIGGAIGNLTGFRGFIDIHEGRQERQALRMDRGVRLPDRHDLGFGIRLDRFEIDRYEPEYRLYVYERTRRSFRAARSFGIEDVRSFQRVGHEGAEVRLSSVYPDFDLRSELQVVENGGGVPALRVELPDQAAGPVNLLAGVPGRDALDLAPVGGPLLSLVWQQPAAQEVARWQEKQEESHVVSFAGPHGHREEVTVEVHGTYVLAGGAYRMRVLEYLPDFTFDPQSRRAFSRSPDPSNPALRVALLSEGSVEPEVRWLLARAPDLERGHGREATGPRLVYRHVPEHRPPARRVLVVGETRQVWEIEDGRVAARHEKQPLDGQTLDIVGEARLTLFPSAEERHEPYSRSDEWNDPVAALELRAGGREEVETHYLPADHTHPLYLPDGRTAILFGEKPNSIRAFRSDLAVIEDGEEAARKTIAVNHPLYHRGYHFYQSNYRRDDPTYSGILVVKDPGLLVAWIGFAVLCIGLVFFHYVRPRLLGRSAS